MNQDDLLLADTNDVLSTLRDLFYLPPNTVYLDGNSLGPLLKRVESRLQKTIREEWGQDLIASWNSGQQHMVLKLTMRGSHRT